MRQMPSVIDTTVPCVRTCAPVSRFWIFDRMSSLISEGLSCIGFLVAFAGIGRASAVNRKSTAQLRSHRIESCLHRAVKDRVAYRNARAADQLRIDRYSRLDLFAEALLERGSELGGLLRREGKCAFDLRLCDVFRRVLQQIKH